jgi:hypothetical protein
VDNMVIKNLAYTDGIYYRKGSLYRTKY